MKIALFEYTAPSMRGITTIEKADDEKYFDNKIRLSEYLEVEFLMRNIADLVPEQVAALDEQIAKVNAAAGKALVELNARKQELLSLTLQGESA